NSIRKITFFIRFLLLIPLLACSEQEPYNPPAPNPAPSLSEAETLFMFRTIANDPASGTENIEEEIREIDIFICDPHGKYSYYREAWPSNSQYKSTLKIEENRTLHFIANCREQIREYLKDGIIREGMDWEKEVRPLLTDRKIADPGKENTPFPMWGVRKQVNITDAKINQLDDISLLRAVASVDVDATPAKEMFTFTSATHCRVPEKGYIVPAAVNYMEAEKKVKNAQTPPDILCETFIQREVDEGTNQITSRLFLYENDDNKKKPSRLVIGGLYKEKTDTTYYPLDFRQADNLVQVMRNHKYKFRISSVSGEGYPSIDDALEASAVNMEYDIIPWDEIGDGDIGIEGPWYFSLAAKQADLYDRVGSFCRIPVSTNVETKNINFRFKNRPATAPGDTRFSPDDAIQNSHFRVEWINEKDEQEKEYPVYLRITALQRYETGYNREIVEIEAGRIQLNVEIRQLPEDDTAWDKGGDLVFDEGKVKTK
ncbi:MAG: hypothetical protein LUD74_01315, partial [Tannerellaceae bacterium]|nr:hypothetical protein [Tannerellaceae bacterium]